MSDFVLTAYNGAILGPIAKGLGWIMNGIYNFFNLLGINNIAVSIILLTVIIYMALFPFTYRQQKFSMLSMKMRPELTAIQNKYKGKRDQQSMMAMQEETQVLYDKYGISPSGSCIQLLIQLPIFFALYRVFYNIPAYLQSVKDIFTNLVNGITNTAGWQTTMQNLYTQEKLNVAADFVNTTDPTALKNFCIDVTYKLSESGWNDLRAAFPDLTDIITATQGKLAEINYFGVLNLSDTVWNIITASFKIGAIGIIICAVLLPVVSYATQMINIKLMPSASQGDQVGRSMKIMNLIMPLLSFVIAFTVPVGLTLYWITGSVTRIAQQFFLNRHFNKMDLDDIIEKNKEKARKKREKRGIKREQLIAAGQISTRRATLSERAAMADPVKQEEMEIQETERRNAPAGSMTAKANMVWEFNHKGKDTSEKKEG